MITKTVFVIVDIIAIIDILFTIRAAMRIKAEYGRWLEYTLLDLINEILDFSKIEAGRMNIITGDYDLQQVIRDCYYFFEEPAGSKDLYLHVRCDEKIPARLKGDAFHIKQILTNMISNAVKYTKAGGVTVDISKKHSLSLTADVCGRI